MTDLPPYPGTPRWVKLSGMIAVGLVLLAIVVVVAGIGGPHGPGRHLPSADIVGEAPVESRRR